MLMEQSQIAARVGCCSHYKKILTKSQMAFLKHRPTKHVQTCEIRGTRERFLPLNTQNCLESMKKISKKLYRQPTCFGKRSHSDPIQTISRKEMVCITIRLSKTRIALLIGNFVKQMGRKNPQNLQAKRKVLDMLRIVWLINKVHLFVIRKGKNLAYSKSTCGKGRLAN